MTKQRMKRGKNKMKKEKLYLKS